MITALLFLVAAPSPKVDPEAERIRIAVAVAIEIAKAKPAPKPPAVVVPGVATEPRFTQDGTPMRAQYAAAPSTASQGIYRTDSIPIPALSTGRYGVTRCVSYG